MISPAMSRAAAAAVNVAGLSVPDRILVMEAADAAADDEAFRALVVGLIDLPGGADTGPKAAGDVAADWDPAKHPRGWHGRWGHGGPGGGKTAPVKDRMPWTVAEGTGTATYRGSLGVDRADMPQLSGVINGSYHPSAEMVPKFVAHLKGKGVPVTPRRLPARSLKPTQTSGDVAAIERIAAELRSGKMRDTKTIMVSSDGRVLDGHHNWAGRVLADAEGGRKDLPAGMPVLQAGLPMKQLLGEASAWTASQGLPARKAGEFVGPHRPAGPPAPADTMVMYMRPDGTWDPERAELHQKIIDGMVSGHARQAHPVAMFFGGGPASGKSSLTGPDDAAKIDPDEIKKQLPEYQQMLKAGDPAAAMFNHEESSYVSKQAVKAAQAAQIHYILDGTGDSAYKKLAGKVAQARSAGYQVHARYVTANIDEAIRRQVIRARESGRMVPEPVLREIHASVSAAYAQAVKDNLFDSTELFDTNGTGTKPRLIAHGTATGGFTVTDPVSYQRFLDKMHQGVA